MIDKPASLTVSSVTVVALAPACIATGFTYGIDVDILYNILGATTNTNVATTVPMTPYEDVTFYGSNGVLIGNSRGDIGPTPGYSDSSTYANDNGTFNDVPVGGCFLSPVSDAGSLQSTSVWVGNTQYPVRGPTRFTLSSSASGHGSVTNGSDASASRWRQS